MVDIPIQKTAVSVLTQTRSRMHLCPAVGTTTKFHLVGLNILIKISSKQPKKFYTFDVSTSIRGLHQKKLVLGLLPVLGATSRFYCILTVHSGAVVTVRVFCAAISPLNSTHGVRSSRRRFFLFTDLFIGPRGPISPPCVCLCAGQ